jgi:pimeloyl-ACP methyl ester carboxylesterase
MISRRTFAGAVAGGAAAVALSGAPAAAATRRSLGQVRHVTTDLLTIAYHEWGPANGEVVLLGHGWPYSPYAYAEVAPALAKRGYRVLVPYLRGNGPTVFRSADTIRSGQQAALGADVIAFMDALGIPDAIFAGYDWGGRGLCVAAALWPERCTGLVSVNSYLIQNLAVAQEPLPPAIEAGYWYFYLFLTERGKRGIAKDPKEFARVVWQKNSPKWRFSEADLDRAATLFTNPDFVDVTVHVYRHRLLTEPGDPRYDDLEARLLAQPSIQAPAVTLDGLADGVIPPTDGSSSARYFAGPRVHHQVAGAGHNLPQEAPHAFTAAVLEVAGLR